jgi:hypothetical protein
MFAVPAGLDRIGRKLILLRRVSRGSLLNQACGVRVVDVKNLTDGQNMRLSDQAINLFGLLVKMLVSQALRAHLADSLGRLVSTHYTFVVDISILALSWLLSYFTPLSAAPRN